MFHDIAQQALRIHRAHDGGHRADHQGVGADAVRRILPGDAFRQVIHARLGHAVSQHADRYAGGVDVAGDRGDFVVRFVDGIP